MNIFDCVKVRKKLSHIGAHEQKILSFIEKSLVFYINFSCDEKPDIIWQDPENVCVCVYVGGGESLKKNKRTNRTLAKNLSTKYDVNKNKFL